MISSCREKRTNASSNTSIDSSRSSTRPTRSSTAIDDQTSGIWQDYTKEDDILRVWQNHGVQVEGVPEGFKLLATSYLCKNQMMVKRSDGQMIYCVQFHLEKSFEDWSKNPTRWEHPNESRDGRILFENFLGLALAHRSSENNLRSCN